MAYHQARLLKRDPQVLMDRYYLLRATHPQAAIKALKIIVQQYPKHTEALKTLIQEYQKAGEMSKAIPLLEQLHHQFPKEKNDTLLLAELYYTQGHWDKLNALLPFLKPDEAQILRAKMASYLPFYQDLATHAPIISPQLLEITNLWNHYYRLKLTQPAEAQKVLNQLAEKLPHDASVHEEAGYFALQHNETPAAINAFLKAYKEKPVAHLALQLAYLYTNQKNYTKAAEFFLLASQSAEAHIKQSALKGYKYAQQALVSTQHPKQPIKSHEMLLLDHYYELKKHNKIAAFQLITQITTQYPNNLTALKEGGYLAVELKKLQEAIHYFTQAYALTPGAELAMQLGYLYNQTDNNYLAYHYFKLATKAQDATLAFKAQNAMTNIAGTQTKVLPKPYFSEVFFSPFSQTRFGLTVRPLVARLGIERNDALQTKVYLLLRQTDDNKSTNLGQAPQIYEDSVRITGVGLQITPFKKVPMVAFVETGAAYDLIYRNRNRWRGDLRGGLMYYQEFGARPAYFTKPTFSTHYYSLAYGDATYFSRYDNNVIGTIKTHQGIRLLQYHSSMINLYVTGRMIEDTNREFFNNIAEIGPGIGFIPSNRFFLEFRYEYIRGVYLPAGGSTNPYSKYYNNGTIQMLFYVKM